MLKSITFKQDFRSFKKDEKIVFLPEINVLVGDQGSGKSTLIELIRSYGKKLSTNENDSTYRARNIEIHHKISDLIEIEGEFNCLAFDFERESPRDMSALHFDMMDEQLFSMKASHGQGNICSLNRILDKFSKNKDSIDLLLLDEPDTAMSPRSCYKLLEILYGIKTVWKKQVIISAHNPILIQGTHPLMKKEIQNIWTEVFSLEEKKWMSGENYLWDQLLPAKSEK